MKKYITTLLMVLFVGCASNKQGQKLPEGHLLHFDNNLVYKSVTIKDYKQEEIN